MRSSITLCGVGALTLALMGTGCATKKFVRQEAGTVQARVDENDKKQTEAINTLEGKMNQSVSRVEERAMTAENKATDAGRAAQQAQQTADSATQMAKSATEVGQQNTSKLTELSNAFQSIDNFKMSSEEEVLFRFNSATLNDEAKAKLDQIAQTAGGMGRFIVEVQGYTDRSGSSEYNLALSRRRADAVVRYLVDKQIPLRRVHMIGLGESTPSMAQMTGQPSTDTAAAEGTGAKMTAKEMRRVVIRTWAPEGTMSASAGAKQ